jgi:hypothetical protein
MYKEISVKTEASQSILIENLPKETFSIPSDILNISNVKITGTDFNHAKGIVIHIESTEIKTCCHQCNKKTEKTDGKEKPRLIRHFPLFSNKTYLCISPWRCRCTCGAITIETFSWHTPQASCTSIYEDHLLLQMINSTLSDVCLKEQIGYDTLKGILSRKIETTPNWKDKKN